MAGDVISTAPVAAPLSSPPQHADGARQSFIDRLTSPGGLLLGAVIYRQPCPVTNPSATRTSGGTCAAAS